jgi:hypothetical protein
MRYKAELFRDACKLILEMVDECPCAGYFDDNGDTEKLNEYINCDLNCEGRDDKNYLCWEDYFKMKEAEDAEKK